MNIFLIDVPLTNLKPALFLGKELEDMIHRNVFNIALFHTNFTDPENENVAIFCLKSRGRLVRCYIGSNHELMS